MEALFFSSKKLSNIDELKPLRLREENAQIQFYNSQRQTFHVCFTHTHTHYNITQIQSFTILTPLSPILSVCDGCDPQTELHRADPYSGSGLAPCAQWQGHGWHCADWIWQDSFCKLLLYIKSHLYLHVDLRASLVYKGVYLFDAFAVSVACYRTH